MAYLQHAPQALPVIDQGQSHQNTRNEHYNWQDIRNPGHWASFNLASIQQQYGGLLATAQIADEPFQPSPARPVNSEDLVKA